MILESVDGHVSPIRNLVMAVHVRMIRSVAHRYRREMCMFELPMCGLYHNMCLTKFAFVFIS